jgi:uncharacterized protein (DUF169 family)
MAGTSDYSILKDFGFGVPPVGVSFINQPPADITRLTANMALCEMLKLSQSGNTFYSGLENHICGGGKYVAGGDVEEYYTNGQFGAGLKVFESPKAASAIYRQLPRVNRHKSRYILFTPLHDLKFDPDVLVILADTNQTEIILRASSYRTGGIWPGKSSVVIGCAWIIIDPYVTGKLNYSITGLGHGMRRKKLFPPGMQFISIPKRMLPPLLETLREMPWELPAFKPDGNEFVGKLLDSLETQYKRTNRK